MPQFFPSDFWCVSLFFFINSWKPISLSYFISDYPMFLNQFMHFLKWIHTIRKKKPCFLIDFTMARLCFNPFRLHKSKNKSITPPSSSSRFHLNNENQNIMERKRFDSLDSWSMILDSENVETWEVSKEDREDWTADLSQLFVGNKFASGAHSRIYRGIYKQRAVAVKMVRIPTHKEETRSLLEQQFKSEVDLLSRLYHPNIVQVRLYFQSKHYMPCVWWFYVS